MRTNKGRGRRVLFLAPRYHTNQISIVDYLTRHGFRVSFWVTRAGVSEDYALVRPHKIRSIPLSKITHVRQRPAHYDSSYRFGLPSPSDIRKFFSEGFDLIIIRNPITVMGILFTFFAVCARSRIVFYTQRDMFVQSLTRKDRLVSLWTRVFRANWITPCLGDRRGTAVKGMYYLPFTISAQSSGHSDIALGPVQIVAVGKFVPRKEQLLLLQALQHLETRYSFELTLVGEHSAMTGDEYYLAVKEFAEQTAFPVRIEENVSRASVFEIYQKADLFVLPSRDEPASVSNLEAMSFGLPVVTSSTNKTSCYTIDNGLVFESGSLESLVSVLEILLSDRRKLTEMGRTSLQLVRKNHNPETVYGTFFQRVFE